MPTDDTRESDYAKGELKAMIERKRRNDFVRKREFDMLRKVRREALSGEQLAALGGSSPPSTTRSRASPTSRCAQDAGVKAKIDEIEQQMVGDGYSNTQRRAPEFYNAPTQPAPLDLTAARPAPAPAPAAPHGGRSRTRHPGAGRRRTAATASGRACRLGRADPPSRCRS